MLEKETELSSAKKELSELEQYQVGYQSALTSKLFTSKLLNCTLSKFLHVTTVRILHR